MKTKPNAHERRRAIRAQAMPEVLSLIKKYDRTIISGCLTQIKEHDKAAKQLAKMQREVVELEQKLKR